jgi:hypothetical protein
MTRLVTFTDGFTSATIPDLGGDSLEIFTLLNNQSVSVNITDLIFSSTEFKTVFMEYEVERVGTLTYRQSGSLIASFNGAWSYSLGNYQGDSIIEESLLNTYSITLSVDASSGQFSYTSGNQAGHTSSKLKLKIVRISA